MAIKLTVDGQEIREYGEEQIVAEGSSMFVQLQFKFSNDWDGFAKVVQFVKDGVAYSLLMAADDTVFIPHEVTHGTWDVVVFGQKAGLPDKATAVPYKLFVLPSGISSSAEAPIPPTPDLYAQLLQDIANYYSMMMGITLVVSVVDGVLNLYSVHETSPIDIVLNDGELEVWQV